MIKQIREGLEFIAQSFTDVGLSGVRVGEQNREGKVVSDAQGEGLYVGFEDNLGTCAYLRPTSDVTFRGGVGSCGSNYLAQVDCKIVGFSTEKNDLQTLLLFGLSSFKNEDFSLSLLRSSDDYDSIFEDETGKEAQGDLLYLCSVDFRLSFDFSACKNQPTLC